MSKIIWEGKVLGSHNHCKVIIDKDHQGPYIQVMEFKDEKEEWDYSYDHVVRRLAMEKALLHLAKNME